MDRHASTLAMTTKYDFEKINCLIFLKSSRHEYVRVGIENQGVYRRKVESFTKLHVSPLLTQVEWMLIPLKSP